MKFVKFVGNDDGTHFVILRNNGFFWLSIFPGPGPGPGPDTSSEQKIRRIENRKIALRRKLSTASLKQNHYGGCGKEGSIVSQQHHNGEREP